MFENFASRGFSACASTRTQRKWCGRNNMADRGEVIQFGEREVRITRPEKVLFPEVGITKRDLVDYYGSISSRILSHLRARPLMLERYPDGIDAARIVQKSVASYYPDWIKTVKVKKAGGSLHQVVCEDA